MKTVTVIPARGGSKGIPRKNLLQVGGKPLLFYTIKASLDSKSEETWVSSDDKEILEYADSVGADTLRRPAEISGDRAPSEQALLHFALRVEFDILVFLQATSPLISPDDIDRGLEMMSSFDSVVSVTENNQLIWIGSEPQYDLADRKRRQDFEQSYLETGGIFITRRDILLANQNRLGGRIGLLEVPKIRSFDIDTLQDVEVVEMVLESNAK